MKTCITCLQDKPLDAFGAYKRYADGKHRICRVCFNRYAEKQRRARGQKAYQPLLNRLWDNIQQCEHEDACLYCCWPWLKRCNEDGYGVLSLATPLFHGTYLVHRLVFELWHGVWLPSDVAVCHHCDFRPCANPAHLWRGSWDDNRQDCVQKGRQARGLTSGLHTHPEAFPRGEASLKAKLAETQVLAIRHAHKKGQSASSLGRDYQVSKFAILCIVKRKTWTHI